MAAGSEKVEWKRMRPSRDTLSAQSLEVFERLHLECFSEQWVAFVWDSVFTECEDIPAEWELAEDHGALDDILKQISRICHEWIKLDKPCAEASSHLFAPPSVLWVTLAESGITVKPVLAALFCFMNRGQLYGASHEERLVGLTAAGTYFAALAIPGTGAFKVFHPVLFGKALDAFQLAGKLKKMDTSAEDDVEMFSAGDVQEYVESLKKVMGQMATLLSNYSLKHHPECMDQAIQVLVELTHLETDDPKMIRRSLMGLLAKKAYDLLIQLCRELHGNVARNATRVFRHLLPSILMTCNDLHKQSALNCVREHSLAFVISLVRSLEDRGNAPAQILIQQICVRVVDKADFRTKCAKAVVELMATLPIVGHQEAMHWLLALAHSERANERLFSLEVIVKILFAEERLDSTANMASSVNGKESNGNAADNDKEGSGEPGGADKGDTNSDGADDNVNQDGDSEEEDDNTNSDEELMTPTQQLRISISHRFLLGAVINHCRDVSATTRAKALQILSDCVSSGNPQLSGLIREVLSRDGTDYPAEDLPDMAAHLQSEEEDFDPLPTCKALMEMVVRRTQDEKVMVRKAAIQLLEKLICFHPAFLECSDFLNLLLKHCRDPSLLVRKQVIQMVNELVVLYPEHSGLARVAMEGILPRIHDPESKAQEKVMEVMSDLILAKLRKAVPTQQEGQAEESAQEHLPWLLLDVIVECHLVKHFGQVCRLWASSGALKPTLVPILRSHLGPSSQNNRSAWMFLAYISQYTDIKDPHFALSYFEEVVIGTEGCDVGVAIHVLEVINNSVKHYKGQVSDTLRDKLLKLLNSFMVAMDLIGPCMDLSTYLHESSLANPQDAPQVRKSWCQPLITRCDRYLTGHFLRRQPHKSTQVKEETLSRQIVTLGEAAQLCPQLLHDRMFLAIERITFQPNMSDSESGSCATPRYIPTAEVQAVGVVTLGKLCLMDELHAKKIFPAFVRLLGSTTNPPLKNNILFILADFCVRFATLVEPIMPQLMVCLKDPSPIVRKTTLIHLIRLLQEDYLKLRGVTFYHLLQVLNDESPRLQNLVTFYLTHRLLARQPDIVKQHIIECLFHLNGYVGHEKYNRFYQTEAELRLFYCGGEENIERRKTIYRFMMERMDDLERFTLTYKLCTEILKGVLESKVDLNDTGVTVLQDALWILCSEEIKLSTLKHARHNNSEDGGAGEDGNEENALVAAVRQTVLSHVVKRNMLENVIPIIVELKKKVEGRPYLVTSVLQCLKEIAQDYKTEVQELLAADCQLAAEVEFDLRSVPAAEENASQPPPDSQGDSQKEASGDLADPQEGPSGESSKNQKVSSKSAKDPSPTSSRKKGKSRQSKKTPVESDPESGDDSDELFGDSTRFKRPPLPPPASVTTGHGRQRASLRLGSTPAPGASSRPSFGDEISQVLPPSLAQKVSEKVQKGGSGGNTEDSEEEEEEDDECKRKKSKRRKTGRKESETQARKRPTKK